MTYQYTDYNTFISIADCYYADWLSFSFKKSKLHSELFFETVTSDFRGACESNPIIVNCDENHHWVIAHNKITNNKRKIKYIL